jgi:hypothetical protein
MNRNVLHRIAYEFVLALLLVVILEVIQIAIAVGNYFDAVMVAQGSAPK